jgi:D-amino-acid dehydrogenase
LPYIGKPKNYDNVVIAGGHAMLGISEGSGTGKIVSDLISNKSPQIDISAFSPERF